MFSPKALLVTLITLAFATNLKAQSNNTNQLKALQLFCQTTPSQPNPLRSLLMKPIRPLKATLSALKSRE